MLNEGNSQRKLIINNLQLFVCYVSCNIDYDFVPIQYVVTSLPISYPKLHYHTHKCPPPVSILSKLNPVHTPTSQFMTIHLNNILPSTPGSPQWSLSLRFPNQNPVHTPLPHLSYMPHPSHSWFYHPHNSGWEVTICTTEMFKLVSMSSRNVSSPVQYFCSVTGCVCTVRCLVQHFIFVVMFNIALDLFRTGRFLLKFFIVLLIDAC
jgi:hypothetical protein